MRKYLIYKTTNKNDGKYYIGAHETVNIKDSYLGSGIHLKRAIKKYGKDCFVREILIECKDRKEMFDEEQKLVKAHLGNPLCYNLKEGGVGGWNYVNQSGIMCGDNNPMKNKDVVKKCADTGRKTREKNPEKYKLIAIENFKKASEKNKGLNRPKEFCDMIVAQNKVRWKRNKENWRDALSTWFEVTSPQGKKENTNRLQEYCQRMNLAYVTLWKTSVTGKTPNRGKAKGWLCRKIIQN